MAKRGQSCLRGFTFASNKESNGLELLALSGNVKAERQAVIDFVRLEFDYGAAGKSQALLAALQKRGFEFVKDEAAQTYLVISAKQ
jgi:hypothetical protein